MSIRNYFALVAASLPLCIPAFVGATALEANLDPFQSVPPHNTPAYGSADATLVGTTFTITTGTYNDLLAGATAVTLNDAAVGTNGPTILVLTLDNPGTLSGTFSGSGTIMAVQANDLLAGNGYINIRDSVFPSGEIRGQLLPEPASLGLFALGGLGLLARRRA